VSALLGVTAAFVVIEAGLRAFHLAPTEGVVTVTEAEFRSIPGLYSPNQDMTDWRKRPLPHHVHINSLGYRGTEFPRDKAAGELRIVMVGDSFTYGDFVNDGDTLPAQLERELARWRAGVRVINAGVGDTTIDAQAKMVERALPVRPDLVILTFTENDLTDLADTSAWDRLAANRKLKSHLPLSVLYPALRRLALWNFALDARARLHVLYSARAAGLNTASAVDQRSRLAARLPLLEVYKKQLIALRLGLDAERIELMLVLFPSHFTVRHGGSTEQLDWLMRAGAEAGVHTVNLLATLRESGQTVERLYLLPDDGHPSARAYAIAVKFLAETISHVRIA